MRASAAVVAAIAPMKATAAAEIMILRHMTYPPVPFLGTLSQSRSCMKTSIGAPMFSGIQIFLSQFLTRKSVLCRLRVSSALHSSWKLTPGLTLLGIRPTHAITRNQPHQSNSSPYGCSGVTTDKTQSERNESAFTPKLTCERTSVDFAFGPQRLRATTRHSQNASTTNVRLIREGEFTS